MSIIGIDAGSSAVKLVQVDSEGKILQIIYAVATKNEEYKATRVFTQERLEQLKVA